MDKVVEKAYAKINLGLDILGKRDDGYHEINTIMSSINLYDELTFIKGDKGISIKIDGIEIDCDIKENLIYKALVELGKYIKKDISVDIHLKKRIPFGAGLAGGSSDAAAALRGVNNLLGLELDTVDLCNIAKEIGADVPYCVRGGLCQARGIGEKLTYIGELKNNLNVIIVKPKIKISTKFAYEELDKINIEASQRPNIEKIKELLIDNDLKNIKYYIKNVFEYVVFPKYQYVREIKKFLIEENALFSNMSGSGSAVFAVFDSVDSMNTCYEICLKKFKDCDIYKCSY